jgi:hypothetical protein
MPENQDANFGVVQFMPYELFQARPDQLMDDYSDQEPRTPSVAGWPKVKEAIRRDGLFVIEASHPGFKATLRFKPGDPEGGDYTIRRLPHGRVETGKTQKLTEIPADEKHPQASMLSKFPHRYFVLTRSNTRTEHPELAWLVGLSHYRRGEETGEAKQE